MSYIRWIPTFLGFPLGGLLAVQTVGSVDGPVSASFAGLLAGAVIGTAQWLAVRSRGLDLRWAIYTALGMAVGSGAAAAVTGARTTVPALVLTGIVAGAAVGAAQGIALGRGPRIAAVWAAVVSLAWALAWLVTANVIVDADRGYVTFGASGALLATVLTGVVLRWVLGPDRGRTPTLATASVERTVTASNR